VISLQNGGYANPARVKRQFRDPHGDWWDKQERRNFGEPVHEDHDILGMFSPYQYTWVSNAKGAAQVGAFILAFLGVCFLVRQLYPDKPSFPREFEGGLERELGGPGALRVRIPLHQLDGRLEPAVPHADILDRPDLPTIPSHSRLRKRRIKRFCTYMSGNGVT
jgi:hypothetical protein